MDKERDEHIAALARVVLYDHEIGGSSNAPEKLAEQVGLPRPATDAGEVELAYAVQVLQQIRRAQAAGDQWSNSSRAAAPSPTMVGSKPSRRRWCASGSVRAGSSSTMSTRFNESRPSWA